MYTIGTLSPAIQIIRAWRDKIHNTRLLRLLERISNINYKICFLNKECNQAVNALSRLPHKDAAFPDILANVTVL